MNYIESRLILLLGKGMNDPDVKQAIRDLSLGDIHDFPPDQCYQDDTTYTDRQKF